MKLICDSQDKREECIVCKFQPFERMQTGHAGLVRNEERLNQYTASAKIRLRKDQGYSLPGAICIQNYILISIFYTPHFKLL
jgi:hypothetical protein